MPLIGHDGAIAAFLAAARSGALHHGWLLAGPAGVGKARFARAAALRLLAEGQGGIAGLTGLDVPSDHPARALMAAGAHPDYRELARLPKDPDQPGEDLARSITIAQVRSLGPLFATAPSLGLRRVVVIDAVDDLERGGANALLKSLEEPPAGTVFLLVSHAPGRLLPTIRSRCRVLRFGALGDADTARVIRAEQPEASEAEVAALVAASEGAPGRGLRYAGLDVAALDGVLATLLRDGDPANATRARLVRELSGKTAARRYEAFLERSVTVLAEHARGASGPALAAALDAYRAAGDTAGAALGLSLDAGPTVFEMAGLVAGLSPTPR